MIELLDVPSIFKDKRKRTSAIVIPITPLTITRIYSFVLNSYNRGLFPTAIHVIINKIVPIVFFKGFKIYGEIVFPIILNRDTENPHIIALPNESNSPIGILVW